MNIRRIYFDKMRNHKHFSFHSTVKALVEAHTPSALKIASMWGGHLSRYAREDEALQKIVKSDYSRLLREADAAREETFIGLTMAQGAARRHFVEARKAAALRAQVVFDAYGGVAKLPYVEQTSAVYNLVQDLLSEKYVGDVREAGLFEWVEELQRRNNAFDALWKRRAEETGVKCGFSIRAERAALDASYRDIIKRVNALIEVEGEEAYRAFVETMNAVVAKYKTRSRRRGAGVGEGEEEDVPAESVAG